MSITGYVFFKEALLHDTGPGHDECADRLVAIFEAFDAAGLGDHRIPPGAATPADLLRVHSKDHIEAVLRLEFLGRKPDAYTVGNNDGREAGRSIDHLHVILLPRYRGDVDNPRGGIRNVIPSRAHYQSR